MSSRELLKLSLLLERIGSSDLSAQVDAIREKTLANVFQRKMEEDLAEKGKLKKKPKFPKKPPEPPAEKQAPGGEEAPPEGGGGEGGQAEEAPPEGGGEGGEPPAEEAPPPEGGGGKAKEPPAETKAQIIIGANTPGDRKWLACQKPKRETIKSGPAWTSMCVFVERKAKKVGYMKRVISRNKKRPREIKLGDTKVKLVNDVRAVGRKAKKKLE